jgi:hypothetical protein
MIKRKFVVCLILSMLILLNLTTVLTIADGYSDSKQSRINSSEKQWTIMFYDDADFYMAGDPLDSFASEAFSSGNINVLVLQDTEHGPATLWYIDENHSKIPLKEMGEVNMGNYTTLEDFVAFGKNNFSAQRYMIFFYGHGNGWLGACRDNTSGNDWLTMDEMQHALTEADGVDIVCFSGPCSMGSIESVYELRECTDVYIASETLSGYNYWRGTFNDLCILLNERSDISNAEVGNFIIQSIKEKTPINEYVSSFEKGIVTYCAINTIGMNDLIDSLNGLIDNLTSNIRFLKFRSRILRHFTRSFITNSEGQRETVDVYDFAKKCSFSSCFNSAIRTKAKNVMEKFGDVVIATFHGRFQLNVHGLSIYFPRFKVLYDKNYTSLNLDFINDTCWDEFLEMYLN